MVVPSKEVIEKKLKKTKKDLLLIHGAWSTNVAFNYLLERLKTCRAINNVHFLEYNTDTHNIASIVDRGRSLLGDSKTQTIVVGHSMGGIVGVSLHDLECVCDIVTVAAPLHGLHVNRLIQMTLAYISPNVLDIMNDSKLMKEIHSKEYSKPITCIVTTRGFNSGWPVSEKTDGVVTISSQKKWIPQSAHIHEVPYSHHEVLQSESFVNIVRETLEK